MTRKVKYLIAVTVAAMVTGCATALKYQATGDAARRVIASCFGAAELVPEYVEMRNNGVPMGQVARGIAERSKKLQDAPHLGSMSKLYAALLAGFAADFVYRTPGTTLGMSAYDLARLKQS